MLLAEKLEHLVRQGPTALPLTRHAAGCTISRPSPEGDGGFLELGLNGRWFHSVSPEKALTEGLQPVDRALPCAGPWSLASSSKGYSSVKRTRSSRNVADVLHGLYNSEGGQQRLAGAIGDAGLVYKKAGRDRQTARAACAECTGRLSQKHLSRSKMRCGG